MASSALASHGKSSGKTRRRVKFNRDTIFNDSDHIALTITRHSFIYDKGYTQYFIKLLCRGVEWTLHKRYRDFYNLHHELIKENQNYNIDLPKLPEKRWFERQRWINRADEKYGWIRRIQLQDYLRAIVKIRVLRNESLSFWKFICMPKRAMIAPSAADEERERENSRSMSMDSRQGSVKPPSNAAVGGLTPQEFKTLRGKLSGAASAAHGTAPGLEPEAAVETDILLDPEADVETEGYNLEEDLEKFNESTELAAREAVLRGLYGSKSPVADVDNIGKPDPNLASPGALKLSKVFDDDGEEMTQAPEGGSADLSYIAVNNAALNNRLTSKDAFASPSTARTPITQVNKMWSGTEIAAALDAINAEEFDTALHFSGPSVSESPTLSIASTSSSVQAPRGEKHGSFSDGRKTLNGSKGHQALSAHAIPPPNGANVNPPVPPAGTDDKKRREDGMLVRCIQPCIRRVNNGNRALSTKKYTLPNQTISAPTLALIESELEESFVRGSGPGGQKINKSKNNVLLVHVPTGISVQCQETRDLSSNRKIARKLLRDKIDLAMNGEDSKLGKKFERIRKKKRNSARRAAKKYGPGDTELSLLSLPVGESDSSDDDMSDDDFSEEEIDKDGKPT